jgi:imidazolonepropionase-like amidohydrolase
MLTVYKCGLLIDGTGRPPVKNASIVVDGTRFKEVLPPGAPAPEGAQVVDLSSYSVVPGLTDMHVHCDYWYSQPNVLEYMESEGMVALLSARNVRFALEKGITTLRDVSSQVGLKMRRVIDMGYIPGPRIFTSAKGISITGGHGSGLTGSSREAGGVDEVRKAVREQIKAGCDLVKLLTSHRSETPEFNQEELNAGVDEAHRRNYRVACHAAIMPAAKMAVLAGVDTLEHGTHLTDEVRQMMKDRGTYLVPTMIAYHTMAEATRKVMKDPDSVSDYQRSTLMKYAQWWLNTDEMLEPQFRKAYELGLKITVGTDIVVPEVEFAPVHTEMEMMVKFGYGEMNTICAATRVAAEALGKEKDMGTIEKGKIADLVAVEGNPLENIANLRKVKMVVKDGRVEIPVPVPYYRWK